MNRVRCLLRLSFIIATAIGGAVATERICLSADWRARLGSEAPLEWQELKSQVGGWQGSIETTRESTGGKRGPQTIQVKGEYRLNSKVNGALVTVTGVSADDPKMSVCGFNPQYDFVLGKNSLQQQELYLREFHPRAGDSSESSVDRAWQADVLHSLFAAEEISGVKLSAVLDGSLGILKSITPTYNDKKLVLRIEYDRKFPDDNRRFPGWALIDPSAHWAVISYEQNYGWGTIRQQVEYQSDVVEVAFPKKIVRITSEGAKVGTVTINLSRPIPCNSPAHAFTLEAFNLEPPKLSPHRVGWRINRYAMTNTILLLVLSASFWLMYRQRKRRRNVP